MTAFVFPSENKVGTFNLSDTSVLREASVAQWVQGQHGTNRRTVISGLGLSIGTGLSVDVAAGYAFADGHIIGITAPVNVPSLTASRGISYPNYIYADITYELDLAVDVTFTTNITGVPPERGVCIGIAQTDATSVTKVTDATKNLGSSYSGSYIGGQLNAGRMGVLIFLGATPKLVIVWGAYENLGVTTHVFGMSAAIIYGIETPQATVNSLYSTYATSTFVGLEKSCSYVPCLAPMGFLVNGYTLYQSGKTYKYVAVFE